MSDCSTRRFSGRELAGVISLSVNSFTFDSNGFVEVMIREHKTLQQSFMREVILPYIEALSLSKNYDDRNEASVALAKAIMERTTEAERCLPFI